MPKRALVTALIAMLVPLVLAAPAQAVTTLTAEIVSWQIVGLDSNDPTAAQPEFFMVQAKVTNTGAEPAPTTAANLSFGAPTPTDCGGPCIFLVSPATYTIGTLAPGQTADAFWTIRVAKTAAALGTETPVTVTATSGNSAPVTATQQPRTGLCNPGTPGGILRVESLISQNRNEVISYTVGPGTQRPDGSWEVVLGTSFDVTVLAHTATTYEEISVPAIVDPSGTITPVSTNFAYEFGGTDDDIYSLGAGGNVTAVYSYSAASIGTVTLSQLIYDCSGGSFHYNSDYRVRSVTIHVVGAPSVPVLNLNKTSVPSGSVSPGSRIDFSIAYSNSGPVSATNVVISDVIAAGLIDVQVRDGGTFDPASRTITWNIGTVPAGSGGTVSFSAVISPDASGSIFNTARATADAIAPVSSPPLRLTIGIPDTGATASTVLVVLALACIGAGLSLRSRL